MKKFFYRLIIFIMAGSIFMRLSVGIQASSGQLAEAYFNYNSAKIEYSPDTWRYYSEFDGPVIEIIKNSKRLGGIRGVRIQSELSYDEYNAAFLESLKSRNVVAEEHTINNFPIFNFFETQEGMALAFIVLIAKDGPGYYEVTFCCRKEVYLEYQSEALKVLKTFQIVRPYQDMVVIKDPEFSAMLKSLDRSAGYDDEAVIRNLSPDGSELVGTWRLQNDPKSARTYFQDGTFLENLNEDVSNYAGGYWRYDPVIRAIIHNYATVMVDGKEMVEQLRYKTKIFAVKNFDKKIMYGFVVETITMQRLVKD